MFPSNLLSYCRRQAAVSCVTLLSCLKYGPHRYRIRVSLHMLGMLSLYFHTIQIRFPNNEMMSKTDPLRRGQCCFRTLYVKCLAMCTAFYVVELYCNGSI